MFVSCMRENTACSLEKSGKALGKIRMIPVMIYDLLMSEIYECTNYIGPAVLTEFFTTKEISYDLRIKICSRYQK